MKCYIAESADRLDHKESMSFILPKTEKMMEEETEDARLSLEVVWVRKTGTKTGDHVFVACRLPSLTLGVKLHPYFSMPGFL
jgi:hypothetical protein